MTFILAYSFAQAKYYSDVHKLEPTSWKFLHEPSQLKGSRGQNIQAVGEWYRRDNINEISTEILVGNHVVSYPHF